MDPKEDFFLSEEAAEWIGLKKSEYLSKLIMQMSGDDFGFEEFHQFDRLIPQTIEAPDRSYEDASDTFRVRTCIRTFHEGVTFHQVVVGALIPDKGRGGDVLIPVLTFITKKEEVVKEWSRGGPCVRPILN